VNNDGTYYPRVSASYSHPRTPPAKLIDGNYWYHRDPPNRWTCEGSPDASDSVAIDLGASRTLHTAKLYFLDDEKGVVPPTAFELEYWDGKAWRPVPAQTRAPQKPTGRRANVVRFPALPTSPLRALFTHAEGGKTGLTEFEAWGDAKLPLDPPPHPAGNIAYNPGDKPFPKAGASHATASVASRCWPSTAGPTSCPAPRTGGPVTSRQRDRLAGDRLRHRKDVRPHRAGDL
jgi:hypothetical protein